MLLRLALLLSLLASCCWLPLASAEDSGVDDPRHREVEVDDHRPDDVHCHSALTNGTFRNRVDLRVRSSSTGVRFDFQYRPHDDNNTEPELEYSVRFDRFVEYVEVGAVNGLDSGDTLIGQINLGAWAPIEVTPVDDNGTQVIVATTLDGRVTFTVVVASQPFATFFAGQQINVTPNSIKFQIDTNLTDYTYAGSSSRLAFRAQVFTESDQEHTSPTASAPNPQAFSFRLTSGGGGSGGGGSGSGGGGSGSGGGGSGSGGGGSGGGADDTTGGSSNSNSTSSGGSSGGTPPGGSEDGGRKGGGAAGCYYTCPTNCYYYCPANVTGSPSSGSSSPGQVENQTESRRNDSARDLIEIGKLGSSSAVKGVFEWVPSIEVNGLVVNLFSSSLSANCEHGDDNKLCSNFFLSINATTPRIISWDPTLSATTKFVSALTGVNNPPATASSGSATLVANSLLLAILTILAMFV